LEKKSLSTAFLTAIIISVLILAVTVHFGTAQSGTNVTGIIYSDTTWTQANSPYTFTGPVAVNAGVTLTIQAGATVNLNTYYLEVNGTLNAIGTSANPLYINSTSVNAGQIKFTVSSTSWNQQTGTGCTIQNAVINQTVISTSNCSIKVSGNTFNDAGGPFNGNVAISTDGGSSTISNNTFNACGLDTSDSSTISNNIITGGMGIYGGSPLVLDNAISGKNSFFMTSDETEYTVAIEDQCSPTLINNTIGSIAFNMNGNGYAYNIFNALITGNTINGGIGIGRGSGNVIISNNTISTNGIIYSSVSVISTTINNNLIINTNIGLQIGDATVQNNTIANSQIGILLNSAVSPSIIWNNLENSSQYNIKLSSTSNNINASNNWWGTTDTQAINQTIYDYKDDFNLGNVTFVPFLTAPNNQAPTYITASAGTGGSINPSGVVSVNYGGSQTFTITPNTGYYIVAVLVNGSSVGAVSSYTVQNIQGATTISATFAPNPTPTPTPSPTPTPTPMPTSTPTPSPTPSPTPTPSATTVPATTDNSTTVDLAITGNITSSQMSNVTIATNQSASTTTVSFTVTGESGTTGFGNVTIPKSAVSYGTTPTIYIDGQPASNQGFTQDSNNYYVWYTTHFSTHQISIVFTSKSSIPEFPSSVILSLVIILAVSVAVVLMLRKRKIGKN
jgi:hypothetical protein